MKKARVIVSILIFSLISSYFLDFADLLPNRLHLLTELQLIPALIAINIAALTIIFLLTIFFGRVYCSSVCPMGIFQDIVDWFAKKMQRKKKYPPLKENKILRWGIVVLMVLAFFSGLSVIISLLDPYSSYGRIASTIFKPAYLFGNNMIAWIDNHFKNYRFYQTEIFITSIINLIIAAATMFIIGFLSYKYGRLFCNTICPVGTVLGFLARFSFFKIRINNDKCNSCSLCAMRCKASCIDAATRTIDYSRCVNCFNCLEVCNRKAMSYSFAPPPDWLARAGTKQKQSNASEGEKQYKLSKRKFLLSLFLMGVAGMQKIFGKDPDSTKQLKEIYTSHNVSFKRKHPITPPGSMNVRRFNDHCTACHLCISKCPSNVLKPALWEYGLIGLLQPAMSFQHGYCNYHCTVCTEICPANALKKITGKEKKTLQPGLVHYIKENCVVVTDGTDCGACSEHCPTQAVSMQPYKKDLRIPVIDENLCVGCGACEYICPVRPFRAIYVDGNPVHKQAKIPEKKKQKKIEVNDFGF
ncbi:MAG: 4Fe-4S dicluster domain-containing protein [Chitinophagales bacterium]